MKISLRVFPLTLGVWTFIIARELLQKGDWTGLILMLGAVFYFVITTYGLDAAGERKESK